MNRSPGASVRSGVTISRKIRGAVPLAGLCAVLATTAGCTAAGEPVPAGSASSVPVEESSAPPAAGGEAGATGSFVAATRAGPDATALTYDPARVPVGAGAEVTVTGATDRSTVTLRVTGFPAGRTFGAHLHKKPCGTDPKAAGGHFQHQPDPAATDKPSVDPKFANPGNEVWLDFTTGADGTATATADQAWAVPAVGGPASLVVHAEKTKTAAGVAGTAGDRLACLTVSG